MEKDGFKFDLETQRFLNNRWETDLGQKVRKEIQIKCQKFTLNAHCTITIIAST